MKKPRIPRNLDEAALQRLGRRKSRELLAEMLLPDWRHVWELCEPDGSVRIMRGEECIATFSWGALRRDLSPDHYRLFAELYSALQEQATTARYAAHVAGVELGVAVKRKGAGDACGRALKQTAAKRQTAIEKEARQLREQNPRLSNSDIASRLCSARLTL